MNIRLKSKKDNTTETFYSRAVSTDPTSRKGSKIWKSRVKAIMKIWIKVEIGAQAQVEERESICAND